MNINRLYQALALFFAGLFLTLPVFAEGFTKGKIRIPFEPKLEIKNKQVSLKNGVLPGKTELLLSFKIDKDAYLYKDSLNVKVNPVTGIKFGAPVFPKPEKKMDPFLKKNTEIYHNSLTIKIPLEITEKAKTGKMNLSSLVGYRGCSKTICFLPQEKTVSTALEIVKKK